MRKGPIVFLFLSVFLAGQDKPLTPGEVQAAYNALRYDHVIQLVKTELEENTTQSPEDLTVYLKYLALALYATEGEDAARGALSSLLLVNPEFEFSPGEASPKIRTLLENIRGTTTARESNASSPPLYITLEDRRNADILASVIRPGQGLINRDMKRGYVYRAVFTASFLGAVAFTVSSLKAHDDYLRASNSHDINKTYDQYNFHYKMRNNLALLTLSVYLANLVDISLTAR